MAQQIARLLWLCLRNAHRINCRIVIIASCVIVLVSYIILYSHFGTLMHDVHHLVTKFHRAAISRCTQTSQKTFEWQYIFLGDTFLGGGETTGDEYREQVLCYFTDMTLQEAIRPERWPWIHPFMVIAWSTAVWSQGKSLIKESRKTCTLTKLEILVIL